MNAFAKVGFGTDINHMLDHVGLARSLAHTIDKERNEFYNVLLARETHWEDGAEELIEEVRSADFLTGVITHARHTNLRAQQARLQHERMFDVIVAKDDMELPTGNRYKPDPFSIELAAEKLGIPVVNNRYVGDLKTDMLLAQKVKIPGILVVGSLTTEDAKSLATHIYSSLKECRARMDEWLSQM